MAVALSNLGLILSLGLGTSMLASAKISLPAQGWKPEKANIFLKIFTSRLAPFIATSLVQEDLEVSSEVVEVLRALAC